MKKQKQERQIFEPTDSRSATLPVHLNTRPTSPFGQFMRNLELARKYAQNNGYETLEESDDFDVGDDFDPESPWELEFDPTIGREVLKAEREELRRAKLEFDEEVKRQRAKPKKKSRREWEEEDEPKFTREEWKDMERQRKRYASKDD